MPVPKKRKTSSKRNSRRKANSKLTSVHTRKCPKCGKPQIAHRACSYCGYYKGREVVDVLRKASKRAEKNKAK